MKTILLIEDNKNILENLIEFLNLEGYITLSSMNGADGIKLATQYTPDLIICDVLMPQMNGYEVLRLLLDNVRTFSIPFIFSTSRSENADRAKTLSLGANDYIVKPYELESLLKMIDYWINCRTVVNA